MLDRIGATLSAICAIHCLLLPLVVGVLPMLGVATVLEPAEVWLTIVAILIAVLSALWSYHKHRELRIVALFFGALGLVIIGLVLENIWYHAGGMVALLGAHILSANLCKSCSHDHEVKNV